MIQIVIIVINNKYNTEIGICKSILPSQTESVGGADKVGDRYFVQLLPCGTRPCSVRLVALRFPTHCGHSPRGLQAATGLRRNKHNCRLFSVPLPTAPSRTLPVPVIFRYFNCTHDRQDEHRNRERSGVRLSQFGGPEIGRHVPEQDEIREYRSQFFFCVRFA